MDVREARPSINVTTKPNVRVSVNVSYNGLGKLNEKDNGSRINQLSRPKIENTLMKSPEQPLYYDSPDEPPNSLPKRMAQ